MKNFDLRYLLIPVIIGIFSFWGYHLAIVAMTPRFDGNTDEFVKETNTFHL